MWRRKPEGAAGPRPGSGLPLRERAGVVRAALVKESGGLKLLLRPRFVGESKEMLRRRPSSSGLFKGGAAPPGLELRPRDGGRSLEPEDGADETRRSGEAGLRGGCLEAGGTRRTCCIYCGAAGAGGGGEAN